MDLGALVKHMTLWSSSHSGELLLAVLALAAVVVALLIVLLRRAGGFAGHIRAHGAPTEGHANDQQLDLPLDLVTELTQLLHELGSERELRRLPELLCRAVLRIFEAEQAIVLVRRYATSTQPGSESRLIVAAMAAPEHGLRMGSEIPLGLGHLGTVAQSQRVLTKRDIARHHDTDTGSWPVFDVAAPLVANDRTLGVIAFSRPRRRHPQAKEILHIIAQMGAMTWTSISTARDVIESADLDELTSVSNKRSLRYKLSELVFDAREKGHPISLFLFDIDNFSHYNDANGQLAGDQLLRAMAQLVRETVRADDVFGRFGGANFMLVLPRRSRNEAFVAAENIRRRIAEHEFPHGEHQPQGLVSVSGGVATFPEDGCDAAGLVQAAEQALRRAKQGGRNQTSVAESGIHPKWSNQGVHS